MTTHDMRPCIRHRAFLACTGRVPTPQFPSNPYEQAYARENTALYEKWVANAWSDFNQKLMPAPTYHGFTHPEFDRWLQRIYLPNEVTA